MPRTRARCLSTALRSVSEATWSTTTRRVRRRRPRPPSRRRRPAPACRAPGPRSPSTSSAISSRWRVERGHPVVGLHHQVRGDSLEDRDLGADLGRDRDPAGVPDDRPWQVASARPPSCTPLQNRLISRLVRFFRPAELAAAAVVRRPGPGVEPGQPREPGLELVGRGGRGVPVAHGLPDVARAGRGRRARSARSVRRRRRPRRRARSRRCRRRGP